MRNRRNVKSLFLKAIPLIFLGSLLAEASPLESVPVEADLTRIPLESAKEDLKKWDAMWSKAPEETISLLSQPMAIPKSAETFTPQLKVKSIHNDSWIAFRLSWKDIDRSEAGKLGEFSDGVALQFPAKNSDVPPPVFMGAKGFPVHIFHWRAQYQVDKERGLRTMRDIYPNMNPDMYPMEFKDEGHLEGLTDDKREVFSHGRAAGNPQSYAKKGVDEVFAEGFGTSSVIQNVESLAHGYWDKKNGWTVIISRPLKRENGSTLEIGKSNIVAFAVWQGGKKEVGSRKSVTMTWVPFQMKAK